MCFDPVSLAVMAAATAAQAGGQRLNQIAQNKAIKGSVAAERTRQLGYQNQADEQFRGSLDRFRPEDMKQKLEAATQERDRVIGGNITASNPDGQYQMVSSDAPQVVKSTMVKSLADAVARSKGEAQRLAKLGSTGAVGFDNALALGDAERKMGTITGFSRGSLGVNMAEQEAAQQKRSGWGDALGLLGQGLNMYNMAGGFKQPVGAVSRTTGPGALPMGTDLGGLY